MVIYLIAELIAGLVAGILIAVLTKKSEGIVYNKLDKIGRITNIILLLIYACLSPLALGVGLFSYPEHDTGFLALLGWIITVINSSAMLFCCLGLGYSVAFRKKGKSKLSFAVQFVGLAAIGLAVGFFILLEDILLSSLN